MDTIVSQSERYDRARNCHILTTRWASGRVDTDCIYSTMDADGFITTRLVPDLMAHLSRLHQEPYRPRNPKPPESKETGTEPPSKTQE